MIAVLESVHPVMKHNAENTYSMYGIMNSSVLRVPMCMRAIDLLRNTPSLVLCFVIWYTRNTGPKNQTLEKCTGKQP